MVERERVVERGSRDGGNPAAMIIGAVVAVLLIGLLLWLFLGNNNDNGDSGNNGDTQVNVEAPEAPDVEAPDAPDAGTDGGTDSGTDGGTDGGTDTDAG